MDRLSRLSGRQPGSAAKARALQALGLGRLCPALGKSWQQSCQSEDAVVLSRVCDPMLECILAQHGSLLLVRDNCWCAHVPCALPRTPNVFVYKDVLLRPDGRVY